VQKDTDSFRAFGVEFLQDNNILRITNVQRDVIISAGNSLSLFFNIQSTFMVI
jgi:hypothetical protein